MPTQVLPPRRNAAAVSLNGTEIAILGGQKTYGLHNDVIIFNTKTETCIVDVKSDKEALRFDAVDNQCQMSSIKDSIIACVVISDNKSALIEYSKGSGLIRELEWVNQFSRDL